MIRSPVPIDGDPRATLRKQLAAADEVRKDEQDVDTQSALFAYVCRLRESLGIGPGGPLL